MNTTSTIELDPLVELDAPQPPSPKRHRLGWAVVALSLAATTILAVVAVRADEQERAARSPSATTVVQAPFAAVGSPEAQRPSQIAVAYSACMEGVGGSADAREQWVDACQRRAADFVRNERRYAACMRDIGGSADSLERSAASCRQRTGSTGTP